MVISTFLNYSDLIRTHIVSYEWGNHCIKSIYIIYNSYVYESKKVFIEDTLSIKTSNIQVKNIQVKNLGKFSIFFSPLNHSGCGTFWLYTFNLRLKARWFFYLVFTSFFWPKILFSFILLIQLLCIPLGFLMCDEWDIEHLCLHIYFWPTCITVQKKRLLHYRSRGKVHTHIVQLVQWGQVITYSYNYIDLDFFCSNLLFKPILTIPQSFAVYRLCGLIEKNPSTSRV